MLRLGVFRGSEMAKRKAERFNAEETETGAQRPEKIDGKQRQPLAG